MSIKTGITGDFMEVTGFLDGQDLHIQYQNYSKNPPSQPKHLAKERHLFNPL
jgi:hypothetical protein